MEDIIDKSFDKLFDEYAEILGKPYRFCSSCRRFNPMIAMECWGYRYLCRDCWNKNYWVDQNIIKDNI